MCESFSPFIQTLSSLQNISAGDAVEMCFIFIYRVSLGGKRLKEAYFRAGMSKQAGMSSYVFVIFFNLFHCALLLLLLLICICKKKAINIQLEDLRGCQVSANFSPLNAAHFEANNIRPHFTVQKHIFLKFIHLSKCAVTTAMQL